MSLARADSRDLKKKKKKCISDWLDTTVGHGFLAFTKFSFNPEEMFDHSIPLISCFPQKISGEFCTLLSCSENMTDGVLEEKKANKTQNTS